MEVVSERSLNRDFAQRCTLAGEIIKDLAALKANLIRCIEKVGYSDRKVIDVLHRGRLFSAGHSERRGWFVLFEDKTGSTGSQACIENINIGQGDSFRLIVNGRELVRVNEQSPLQQVHLEILNSIKPVFEFCNEALLVWLNTVGQTIDKPPPTQQKTAAQLSGSDIHTMWILQQLVPPK